MFRPFVRAKVRQLRRMNTDVCRWFLSGRRMLWPDPVRSRKNTIAACVGPRGHGVMMVQRSVVLNCQQIRAFPPVLFRTCRLGQRAIPP
jgi:hypothetical protein